MKKKYIPILLSLFSTITALAGTATYWKDCDWQIKTPFPKDFLWGAGISHYQYEGKRPGKEHLDYNSFDLLADTYIDGKRHESIQHLCGDACKGWEKALDDVDLVYDIGLDVYRMALSWEKINPAPGEFDESALQHYIAVLDKCNRLGIKVLMGLHHYTEPIWFTELGGWTKRENNKYFADFCRVTYRALGDRVWKWATFNNPSNLAKHFLNGGMIAGIDANGEPIIKKRDFDGYSNALCNMCLAHIDAYEAIKDEFNACKGSASHRNDPQVGFLKNIFMMEGKFWFWDKIIAQKLNYHLNDQIIEFFTTGVFRNGSKELATDNRAPYTLDFIGLNHYSHKLINNFKPSSFDGEIPTQNGNYSIYPEGLYYALEKIDKDFVRPISIKQNKAIPLYVTENGIAAINDSDREIFFKRYMYALHKAIENGIPVKGYVNWSLMDNYEWGSYDKKYGLYHVDFTSPNKTRTLKTDAGTQFFVNLVNQNKQSQEVYA